jgi:tetratricopeptide (TPR) repeat protein
MTSFNTNSGSTWFIGLQTELADILASARVSAHTSNLHEPFADQLFDLIADAADQETNYTTLQIVISQYIQDAQKCQLLLQDLLNKIQDLEASQMQHKQYDERWWQQAQRRLHTVFADNPQKGFGQWIHAYTGALIAWHLDMCAKLLSEPFAFPPQAADVLDLVQRGTDAIQNGPFESAIEMIEYLLRPTPSVEAGSRLDDTGRAILLILLGRIYLYKASQPELAREQFEHARNLAPKDGRPYAALGEYHRIQAPQQATTDENGPTHTEYDQARQLYEQAIQLPSGQVDGYIGKGLLFELQRAWDEADDNYQKAIQELQKRVKAAELSATLGALLAPVSGNLYLQLARMLKKVNGEFAIGAIDRAMELGIKHEGDYPERIGYRLKGEILETLVSDAKDEETQDRMTEAALAYCEAGKRFHWREDHQVAVEMLKRSHDLNTEHIPTYWYLASTQRMLSYRPEPPFADRTLIRKALVVWERGVRKQLPDSDDAWVYSERALIADVLSRLPGANRWKRKWESIVFFERALVLRPWDTFAWTYLGGAYDSVEAGSNALHATGKAVEHNPADVNALNQRITTRVNLGEFAELEDEGSAIALLEKRQKLESADSTEAQNVVTSADAIKAYILLHTGEYKDALGHINKAIKTDQDPLWMFTVRADCLEMLGEREPAEQDYRLILNRKNPKDCERLSTFGWAAYRLGGEHLAQAVEIFEDLRKNPIEFNYAHQMLGLCYLLSGELVQGEEVLQQGIAHEYNVFNLNEMLDFEFPHLRRSVVGQSDADQVLLSPDRLTQLVQDRIAAITPRRSALDELEDIVATLKDEGDFHSCAWIGTTAGLARLYAEDEHWDKAARLYQTLYKSDQFPEARTGLEKVVEGLSTAADRNLDSGKTAEAIASLLQAIQIERELDRQEYLATLQQRLGDALLKAGRLDDALEQYIQTRELEPVSADKMRWAGLQSRVGFVHFEQKDFEAARTEFAKAISLYRESDHPEPGQSLAAICRALLRDANQYWALDATWEKLANHADTDEILRQDLLSAKKSLANYLDELYKLPGDPSGLFIPVVTPILAEFADNLVPKVDNRQDGGKFIHKDIPAMRDRIRNDMGVQVTGVRARGNPSLAPGAYVIELDEIPVASGTAQVDMGYCPESSETLRSLGLSTQTFIQAPHPRTGEAGYWIPQKQWDPVTNHGLELLTETDYIISHMESVLRRNLTNFLNMQSVESIVKEWEKNEPVSALVKIAIPDENSRLGLSRLLRALVRERVPITNGEAILSAIQDDALASDKISETVRAVRLRLKQQLPGNNPGVQYLELPPDMEDTIASWLKHENDKTFFAASPRQTHQLLSSIRDWLRPMAANVVLVARSSELRPYVRRMIESEFPDLLVLSREEVFSQNELSTEAQAVDQEQIAGASANVQ